jgi:hypothetical protein
VDCTQTLYWKLVRSDPLSLLLRCAQRTEGRILPGFFAPRGWCVCDRRASDSEEILYVLSHGSITAPARLP